MLVLGKKYLLGHFNWSLAEFGKELHLEARSVLKINKCYLLSKKFTGWKSRDSVPQLVEKYLGGDLKVDQFITHTMPLSEINDAFKLMSEGKRFVIVIT